MLSTSSYSLQQTTHTKRFQANRENMQNLKQIDQTKVLFKKIKPNKEIYYFPTFLRVKVNNVLTIDSDTRFSQINLDIFVSVFYGSTQQAIVRNLQKKIYVKTDFNDQIRLDWHKSNKQNNTLQQIHFILDETKSILHWKIVLKQFRIKIHPFILFHPFTELQLISKIKIPAIQFTLPTQQRHITALFNLLDNDKMHKKIIEQQDISNINGFQFSSNYMSLVADKRKESIIKKNFKQIQCKYKVYKQKTIKQKVSQEQFDQEDEDQLDFKTQQFKKIRSISDQFSTATLKIHLHFNLRIALTNFASNLFFFILLASLSLFVYFQKMDVAGILASLATIGVAFGAFMLSIRDEIHFKPGSTFAELMYIAQTVLLMLPLYKYWYKIQMESIAEKDTPLVETWKQTYNSTNSQQSGQLLTNTTVFMFQFGLQYTTKVLEYFQLLLDETQGKPLSEQFYKDFSFELTVAFTEVALLSIMILLFHKIWKFGTFKRQEWFDLNKAESQFLRFRRTEWYNIECRKYFNDHKHEGFVQLQDKNEIKIKYSQNSDKVMEIELKLLDDGKQL